VSVYQGEDGVIASAKPGTVCIDLSTIDPQTSRAMYTKAKEKNVGYIDAPVSGGPSNALDGSLIPLIGGDDEDIAKANAVFQALGGNGAIHKAGPSGSGAVVKLVNNAIALTNMITTAEGFVLGVKAGVDPDTLFKILNTSGARSYHLNKRIPWVLAGDFEPRFKLGLARKDVGLALDMAHQMDMPLQVISQSYELLNVGMASGWGEEDCMAVIRYFENLAGVEVRSKKS
jgi:3-hydroxyisobutyrate dehydrogenase